MRIMGIDASPSTTGVAIYDTDIKDFTTVCKFRSSIKKATPTLGKRIDSIVTELSHLLFWEAVDIVIIEDIYVNQVSSAIPLAQIRGAIQDMVYGMDYEDLLVIESSKIKKEVTGKGNASKLDVYNRIKKKYKNSKLVRKALGKKLMSKNNAQKNEDMADACAIIDSYLQNPSIAHPA